MGRHLYAYNWKKEKPNKASSVREFVFILALDF